MSVKLYRDDNCHIEYYAKKASTAMVIDDVVYLDGNGYVTVAGDASLVPLGLLQKAIATTDSDYASTTRVPVLVCGPDAEFEVTASSTSAATTDIGEWVDLDGAADNPERAVDVGTSSNDIFYVTDVISTTKVIAKMAKKSGAAA